MSLKQADPKHESSPANEEQNEQLSPDMAPLLRRLCSQMRKDHVVDLYLDEYGNLEMSINQVRHVNMRLPGYD